MAHFSVTSIVLMWTSDNLVSHVLIFAHGAIQPGDAVFRKFVFQHEDKENNRVEQAPATANTPYQVFAKDLPQTGACTHAQPGARAQLRWGGKIQCKWQPARACGLCSRNPSEHRAQHEGRPSDGWVGEAESIGDALWVGFPQAFLSCVGNPVSTPDRECASLLRLSI